MRAWFAGDFEQCLALCETVRHEIPRPGCTFRFCARAHCCGWIVRTTHSRSRRSGCDPGRHRRIDHDTHADRCGRVRCGDVEAGLAMRFAAAADARRASRRFAPRLALNVGLAHFGRRDFAAADRALGASPAMRTSSMLARSSTERWIAIAPGKNEQAATAAPTRSRQLDECRHHDAYFEANCTRALAHLVARTAGPGGVEIVAARRPRIDAAAGLAEPRFWIAYCAPRTTSTSTGTRSERRAKRVARKRSRRATHIGCRHAASERASHATPGRLNAHRDHIESALELFENSAPTSSRATKRSCRRSSRKSLPASMRSRAAALFATYRALSPLPPIFASQSPSNEAFRRWSKGRSPNRTVIRARGRAVSPRIHAVRAYAVHAACGDRPPCSSRA